MDWISGLQKSIEYIEANLMDDYDNLALDKISAQANSSEYNFQKIFSIVTGVTVGEYIRNRRLALAGEELLLTDSRILDIALKYGYETAESFTKAFTRFHGITPKAVRKNNAELKLYNRLNIHIKVEGGSTLDYRVVRHDSMRILARSMIFSAAQLEDHKAAIQEFMTKCQSGGLYEFLNQNINEATYFTDSILGYHDSVSCNQRGSEPRFSVGVEYKGDPAEDASSEYQIVEIPAGKWLVFCSTGRRPAAIQNLWYRIYTEFLPFSSYQIKETGTLEVCREGFRNGDDVVSELWLPLANG
jgi:AraC family transcriptional regulator